MHSQGASEAAISGGPREKAQERRSGLKASVPVFDMFRALICKDLLRQQHLEDLKRTHEEERSRLEASVRRLEHEVLNERRTREEMEMREGRLAEDLRRRLDGERMNKQHNSEVCFGVCVRSRVNF